MLTRRLGRTDLELSVIGCGTWAIGGGGWKFGWGAQDDDRSIAAIHEALRLGVNWIDTARVYGLGRSERVVRMALDATQATVHLVTKCTRVWDEDGEISGSMDPDSIRRELEASVEALGGRAVDLYLIHQPKPDHQIEQGWSTLNELKREGLVRYVGVSNFSLEQLARAEAIAPVDAIEPRYSLVHREIEQQGILKHCEQAGIGVIAYSPMASGLLTGRMTAARIARLPNDDWRRGHDDFQPPALDASLALAAKLEALGHAINRSPGAMACAWALADPRVTACIVGFRTAEQVADVLGDDGYGMADTDFAEVRRRISEA